MAKGKGYKLTSAAGDGPKLCAFFFSDKGCRSGVNCKFSHEQAAAKAAAMVAPKSKPSVCSSSSSSVMSSESESDGEIVENKAGAYASLAVKKAEPPAALNPFLQAVSAPVSAPPAVAIAPPPVPAVFVAPAMQPPVQQQEAPPTSEKKKKRKKRKKSIDQTPVAAEGGNPFDFGKAETQNPPVAAATTPPVKKTKKEKTPAPQKVNPVPPIASFRNLQLPIASFSLPITNSPKATLAAKSPVKSPRPPSPQHEDAPTPPPMPLPIATPDHLKWKSAVIATQTHTNYATAFSYDRAQKDEFTKGISGPNDWFTSRPYGQWCAANPAAIAIDCEMCETKDAASGNVDSKALCRISVVNALKPDEVLLDTLVKPDWAVSDHRTWINGISASDLENVQFTLKHAQQFMAALCSEQTVVVGHAVHNDFMALRMIHHCNVDTAMLFQHAESTDGTPSLKNLALGVMKREMPDVHDSVNDARVALLCALDYVDKNGKVEPIEKVFSRKSSGRMRMDAADTTMLLVHRLPPNTQSNHISEMFLAYTNIKPKNVPEPTFSGTHGKCNVEFTTRDHAELAYISLVGEEREDKTGKNQKRVGLKGGGYVCVRKMKKSK